MVMRRLVEWVRRIPASPARGEVAGANVGGWLQPYIGELPLNPRLPARDAYYYVDETEALRTYRQTLRDERCAAALDQRLNAAISTPWEVEPGGTMARDKRAAEDLAEQLQGIEFNRICRQLLHGVWYGWSVAEAMWGRDARRVVLDDLVVRAPDRFWWSTAGELLLRTWHVPQGEPVPPAKFVVLARPGEHSDLPYTPGLARWCFWPVWLKRHGLKFWSVALEKFGAPTAKGTYPRGAGDDERKRLLDLVHGLAAGAGVVVPDDQDIELLATAQRTGGSGGMDFASFVGYLDRCITTTILGQSSTTDQGPWRGTAEVQRDVRDETIAADAMLLDSALNATIARWLTHWNFPGAAVPRIRHDAEPADDLDARAKREKAISETTGLRPTLAHITNVYGGEWEDRPRPAPAPSPGDAADGEMASEVDDDNPDAPTVQTERLRRDAMPVTDEIIDTIRSRVEDGGSESLDALAVDLARMLPDVDRDDLIVLMGEALMAAELAGRYDVLEGEGG